MYSDIAVFQWGTRTYHADTCEPLKRGVERGEVTLVARARGAYPGDRLRPDDVPEVRTVGYWDALHDQRWGLDWHRNEGIELTFVAQGIRPLRWWEADRARKAVRVAIGLWLLMLGLLVLVILTIHQRG